MIHGPFGFWRTPQFVFRQFDKKDSSVRADPADFRLRLAFTAFTR
jgi:hypothetical protein